MRRYSWKAVFALWGAIVLAFPGVGVRAAGPGETVPGRQGVSLAGQIDEICFPREDAVGILRDLEGGRGWKKEAEACRDWQDEAEIRAAAADNLIGGLQEEVRKEKAAREAAMRQAEENLRAGREAVKVAKGPWYEAILSAGKWIVAGLVAGYILGKTGR